MPKGHKTPGGYATVAQDLGGLGYREISEIMCEDGYKMNHSTARNIFLSAMRKFAKEMCTLYDIDRHQEKIKEMAADPRFQMGIYSILVENNDI